MSRPYLCTVHQLMYEVFEHTADLGLRIRAQDLESLFVDAARGLFSTLVVNLDDVQPVQEKQYVLEGDEYDLLLFDWLSELLYTFDTEKLLLCQFQVTLGGSSLRAVGRGERMDAARHEMDHEVKAITYHGLRVEKSSDGWLAEVIVDI